MCNCTGTSKYVGKGGLNKSNPKSEPVCLDMYEELRSFDLIIIGLLRKDKRNLTYKSISNQLRTWIGNLREQCPPESDYVNLKIIVKNVNPDS